MNVFELGFVLIVVLAGYYVGKTLGFYWGTLGWVAGFILGIVSAASLFIGLFRLVDLWHRWRPMRPPCRSGKCMSGDYNPLLRPGNEVIFQCGCGTKYVKKGRRFMELGGDGSARPYMIKRGLSGRWEKDEPSLSA